MLGDVGYSEASVEEMLGADAYTAGREQIPVLERRLPRTPLAAVVRACFLGVETPVGEAPAGLAQALAATGLARASRAAIVPFGRIAPVEGLLLASDAYSRGEDPPDYVATYTPTARTCALLTPRRRVRRALDVGTGGGIQALLAARHSERVVATDVNERALAFAAFNAAVNGFGHVEVRRGSLFGPVEAEAFDLITCNAPFVVSPESRFVFRDGALPADELSRSVVAGAASHLADGGFATLLVSWVSGNPDDADAHPAAWAAGTGCDAWALAFAASDALDHAAGWNDYLEDEPDRYAAALDEWAASFAKLGIGWITEGALLLHRRHGNGHRARFDPLDEDTLEDAAAQVERVFASRSRLAQQGLARVRVRLAPRVRIVREYDRTRLVATTLRQLDGLCLERSVSPRTADAVAALGRGAPADTTLRRLVRELVDLGFLEVV